MTITPFSEGFNFVMSMFNLAQFQTLAADERLTIAMSFFESFVLSQPKFELLQVSSVDPVTYSELPASLVRVYDWISKFALKEKNEDTRQLQPFDSDSLEWAIPGISLQGFSSVRKDRSVIAWIPGGPYRCEVEMKQADSNVVYIVNSDDVDEFPDDYTSVPMDLSDFITTFLLSEAVRKASLSIASNYIATKFRNSAHSVAPFWIGSLFPDQRIEFFDWDGILVEKDSDNYCFGADSSRVSQLQELRGKVTGFKMFFFKRCNPISQSERFEISVQRIPADERSGRVTIEVGKLTSYQFWQQFGETVQFDALAKSLTAASGAHSYGSHFFTYEGEGSAQGVLTLRIEELVSFVDSVIERIDPRMQDQCREIVSSTQRISTH